MEFTVQYMVRQDWHRVTAIYDYAEDAGRHAKDMLLDGNVVRVICRMDSRSEWHTIRTEPYSKRFETDEMIFGCPK